MAPSRHRCANLVAIEPTNRSHPHADYHDRPRPRQDVFQVHGVDAAGNDDRRAARRVRKRRIALGLSLQEMAARAGVSYQAAHKYETGINRMSVGRLVTIATARSAPRQARYWRRSS
jgi:DNA-binding XRE family transcriptional regulator